MVVKMKEESDRSLERWNRYENDAEFRNDINARLEEVRSDITPPDIRINSSLYLLKSVGVLGLRKFGFEEILITQLVAVLKGKKREKAAKRKHRSAAAKTTSAETHSKKSKNKHSVSFADDCDREDAAASTKRKKKKKKITKSAVDELQNKVRGKHSLTKINKYDEEYYDYDRYFTTTTTTTTITTTADAPAAEQGFFETTASTTPTSIVNNEDNDSFIQSEETIPHDGSRFSDDGPNPLTKSETEEGDAGFQQQMAFGQSISATTTTTASVRENASVSVQFPSTIDNQEDQKDPLLVVDHQGSERSSSSFSSLGALAAEIKAHDDSEQSVIINFDDSELNQECRQKEGEENTVTYCDNEDKEVEETIRMIDDPSVVADETVNNNNNNDHSSINVAAIIDQNYLDDNVGVDAIEKEGTGSVRFVERRKQSDPQQILNQLNSIQRKIRRAESIPALKTLIEKLVEIIYGESSAVDEHQELTYLEKLERDEARRDHYLSNPTPFVVVEESAEDEETKEMINKTMNKSWAIRTTGFLGNNQTKAPQRNWVEVILQPGAAITNDDNQDPSSMPRKSYKVKNVRGLIVDFYTVKIPFSPVDPSSMICYFLQHILSDPVIAHLQFGEIRNRKDLARFPQKSLNDLTRIIQERFNCRTDDEKEDCRKVMTDGVVALKESIRSRSQSINRLKKESTSSLIPNLDFTTSS